MDTKDTPTPPDPQREAAAWLQKLTDYPFPLRIKEGLALYLGAGIRPGSFLSAVLENNLLSAVRNADPVSQQATFGIVRWLANQAPATAWGSERRVSDYIAEKRNAQKAVTA